MISKKIILSGLLLTLTIMSFGQPTHVLKLKNKKYYSERNHFFIDSSLKIIQEVGYDRPHTVDEGYSLTLTINIIDTLKAMQKKNMDLTLDTSIIKCSWDMLSVWNWEEERTEITGQIKILSWTSEKIKIDLDISVLNLGNGNTFIYSGKRVFPGSTGIYFKNSNK